MKLGAQVGIFIGLLVRHFRKRSMAVTGVKSNQCERVTVNRTNMEVSERQITSFCTSGYFGNKPSPKMLLENFANSNVCRKEPT
jgi:hypothetical protein